VKKEHCLPIFYDFAGAAPKPLWQAAHHRLPFSVSFRFLLCILPFPFLHASPTLPIPLCPPRSRPENLAGGQRTSRAYRSVCGSTVGGMNALPIHLPVFTVILTASSPISLPLFPSLRPYYVSHDVF